MRDDMVDVGCHSDDSLRLARLADRMLSDEAISKLLPPVAIASSRGRTL